MPDCFLVGVFVVLSYPVLHLPYLDSFAFFVFLSHSHGSCDHRICISPGMKNQDGHWDYC